MTPLRAIARGLLVTVATLIPCLPTDAQSPALSAFKPSDVYFQAWLTVRDAEKAEKEGRFL